MTETQRDYIRLEDEKFQLLQFGCRWRTAPKIKGVTFCLASTEACRRSEDCAIWGFLKGLGLV